VGKEISYHPKKKQRIHKGQISIKSGGREEDRGKKKKKKRERKGEIVGHWVERPKIPPQAGGNTASKKRKSGEIDSQKREVVVQDMIRGEQT